MGPAVTLEDYKRVRGEEYASAAIFSFGTIMFGYFAFEGIRNNDDTFFTLIHSYLAIGCSSLVGCSFEQGRKMSREVSRLETKLDPLQ